MDSSDGHCACGGACPRCASDSDFAVTIEIGPEHDQFEVEAERVAESLVASPPPAPPVAPPPAEPASSDADAAPDSVSAIAHEEIEPPPLAERAITLAAAAGAPPPNGEDSGPSVAPATVHTVLASPGAPLDLTVREEMESRFAADFSSVRVHADGRAGESARDVNAAAYTVGPNIVFGHGAYAPRSPAGRKLLAHELTHVVQQGAARSPARVQRDGLPGTTAPAAAPTTRIERKIAELEAEIEHSQDPLYTAYLARAQLLLGQAPDPLPDDATVQAFVERSLLVASSESDTLALLGPSVLWQSLAFPETWSRKVIELLDLGVDVGPLRERAIEDLQHVTEIAATVPAEILAHGLPVSFSRIGALRHFELLVQHVGAPGVTGTFARAVRTQLGSSWVLTFYVEWDTMTRRLATEIAEGRHQVDYKSYVEFERARRQGISTLVARIGQVSLDSGLTSLDKEVFDLSNAAFVQGFAASLVGLATMVGFWGRGKELFANELAIADRTIEEALPEVRIVYAMKWAYDNSYFSGAGDELLASLRQGMWGMIGEIGVIIALQFVPIVDVAVDVYLIARFGFDVLDMLYRLSRAFTRVKDSRSVLELQRNAAELVSVIESGALMLGMLVATWGLAKGVKAVRARSARLRSENPGLSEEGANRRALEEDTPQTKELRLAQQVKEFLKAHGNSRTAQRALSITGGVIEDAEEIVKTITGDASANLAIADRYVLDAAAPEQRAATRAVLRDNPADVNLRRRFLGENTNYVEIITHVRGYPFGFNTLARFTQFKATVRTALRDFGLPNQDVRVHGSSVLSKVNPPDIDVAVIVGDAEFAEVAARVREGIRTRRVMDQFESGLARGKIGYFVFPRIEGELSFGQRIYGSADVPDIDLSIIRKGGEFDIGPYLNF